MKNFLINIQFLRAIAALLVVMYHTSDYAHGGKTEGNIFSFIEVFGYIGVDIFFVISGYIIYLTAQNISGMKGILGFIYNRVTRIYLGYWSFIIPFLLIHLLLGKNLSHYDILGSFFLTSLALDKLLIAVSWTLTFELYFYAIFIFLFLLPRKFLIPILAWIFIIISLIQLWAYIGLHLYVAETFDSVSIFYTFFVSPYTLEFIGGCFIAYYFEYKRISNLKLLFFVCFLFFIVGIFYQNYYLKNSMIEGYYIIERVFFFGNTAILLVMGIVEMNKRDVIIFPKFSLLVGNASYSLYLSHTILLLSFYFIGLDDFIQKSSINIEILMLAIVILIVLYSILHYKWIELPLLQKANKIKSKIIS